MPDIQTSDPGRKLQERYDLVGPPPSPFLSPELVPVVLVDDLTELSVLDRTFERPATVNESSPPVVAAVSVIAFDNPVDSGVLAIMEWGLFNGDSDYLLQVFLSATLAGILDNGSWRDSRISGQPVCGVGPTSEAQTLRDFQISIDASEAEAFNILTLPFIVSPGFSLRFAGTVDNSAITAQLLWRERTLSAGVR